MGRILPEFDIKPVVLPFDGRILQKQFNETANALDERFDINKAQADKLALLALQMKVLPGDQHIKEEAVQKIRDEITRINEQGIGFENAGQIISTLAQDFVGDEQLTGARTSFTNRQKEIADVQTLRLNEKQPAFFDEDISGFQTVTTDEFGKETITPFQSRVEAQQDPLADAITHFGRLASDLKSQGIALESVPGRPGLGVLRTGSVEEITDTDINNRIEAVIDQYLQSPEGGDQFRRLREQEFQQANPEGTQEEMDAFVREEAREQLITAGGDQQFRKEREGFQEDSQGLAFLRAGLRGTKPPPNLGGEFNVPFSPLPESLQVDAKAILAASKDGNLSEVETTLKRLNEADASLIEQIKKGNHLAQPNLEITMPDSGGIKFKVNTTGRLFRMKAMFNALNFIGATGQAADLGQADNGERWQEILLQKGLITETDITRSKDAVPDGEIKRAAREKQREALRTHLEEFNAKELAPVFHSREEISGSEADDTTKGRERANSDFFAPDKKTGIVTTGGLLTSVNGWDISQHSSTKGKLLTGTEIANAENKAGSAMNIVGRMTNNNPYAPGARYITNNLTGDSHRRYIIEGSAGEKRANGLEWNFHQVEYSSLQEHKFSFTHSNGKQTEIVIQADNAGVPTIIYHDSQGELQGFTLGVPGEGGRQQLLTEFIKRVNTGR